MMGVLDDASRRLPAALSTALIALVVLAAYVSTANAATPTFCAQGKSPYELTPAQRHECGDSGTPLTRIEPMPGGGTAYVYANTAEGSVTTFRVPPSTFDAATASNEELKRYGIPVRPSQDSPAYPRWVSMAEDLHIEPPPAEILSVPHRASEVSNANWSGYVDDASSQIYGEAYAWFTQPTEHSTACGLPVALTWVGLGGFNSGQLAQVGTSAGESGMHEGEFWWEILPEYQKVLPMPTFYGEGGYALPGESAYAEVKAYSNYEFYFYVYAKGKAHSFTTKVSQNGYDGSSADFIVERPEGYSFKNFGEVHFEGYANAKSIESYGHKSIEAVYPSTKDLMARPGSLSGTKFTDYHYNCL